MSLTRREALHAAAGVGLGASAIGIGSLGISAVGSSDSARKRPTITCLGDSFSDVGMFGGGVYPAWLGRFLAPIPVTADGLTGNDTKGVLARCRPDGIHTRSAVHKPGSISFVLAGTIDLLYSGSSASQITANLARIYTYLARHGSTVYPVTIPPLSGSGWLSSDRERVRVAVNAWILRHAHPVNAELVLGDGGRPPKLHPALDLGDGVHLSRVLGAQTLALTAGVVLVPR